MSRRRPAKLPSRPREDGRAMTCEQIAVVLGITPRGVESTLARALRKMRERLLKVDRDPRTWRTWA